MEVISQLVCQRPQPGIDRLEPVLGCSSGLLMSVGPDGTGDGVVDAAVQCTEFVDFDWGIELVGEICDRLTHIAIVEHNLLERKALIEQIASMKGSHVADFGRAAATGWT